MKNQPKDQNKTKLHRQGTTRNVSDKMRSINTAAEAFTDKIRGSEYLIICKLVHDFLNAELAGRVGALEDYQSGKIATPCIIRYEGADWLVTAPALMLLVTDFNMSKRTISRIFEKWETSLAIDCEINPFVRLIVRGGTTFGNETAILLDSNSFALVKEKEAAAPKTHPHKPPDPQGKADIDGQTLTPEMVAKLATRFNRKFAS